MNKLKRKTAVAGNWKMNKTLSEAKALIEELKPVCAMADCEVILCVPFTNLLTAVELTKGTNLKVGAQNCHFASSGAYTGEISAPMLGELGVDYVILGHSERRSYFAETDAIINQKVKAVLEAGLKPILCVGELLEQREDGITEEVCAMQIKLGLKGISKEEIKSVMIAYEPVWAIGTGKTATAEEANAVNGYIRGVLELLYDKDTAQAITIQYGGSMNAKNAQELLSMEHIDGGLIGGASLKAADFGEIIKAASR